MSMIKLPPLPYIDPYFPVAITAGLLQAYATAAVEADRQARGEPVAWITELSWPFKSSEQVRKITKERQPTFGFNTPLYTTPPPAHSEAEVQEILIWKSASGDVFQKLVRRILGVEAPK